MKKQPIYVSYGAGVDSTGMLIAMKLRGFYPHAITFANTKSEGPWVLDYVYTFTDWLVDNGFPAVSIVEYAGGPSKDASLEAECLRTKGLPGLAYGNRSCSDKWKQQPQRNWVAEQHWALATWKAKKKIKRAIGFDCGEAHRAIPSPEPRYENWYPLIDWRMFRDDCIQLIRYAGLPIPRKSSCFFCPSMSKEEVRRLSLSHNDLYQRGLAIESNANLTHIEGLGREWSWKNTIGNERGVEMPCMCFDGECSTE